MRTTILFLLTIILLTTLGCSSCKKNVTTPDNPYGLPNATQTGANVFACRVNGQNFITDNSKIKPGSYPYYVGAQIISDTLLIGGGSQNNVIWDFILKINKNIKSHNIDNVNTNITLATDSTSCTGVIFQIKQYQAISGSISITRLDTINKITSGIFSSIIPIENCDTLKITDGRFDINY